MDVAPTELRKTTLCFFGQKAGDKNKSMARRISTQRSRNSKTDAEGLHNGQLAFLTASSGLSQVGWLWVNIGTRSIPKCLKILLGHLVIPDIPSPSWCNVHFYHVF